MNPDVKEQWVNALRSGEYRQAKGGLGVSGTDQRCCLGVLCDLAVENGVIPPPVVSEVAPGWLSYEENIDELPVSVIRWAGVESKNPMVNAGEGPSYAYLSELNDDIFGWSFDQIADIIEKEL